MAKVTAREMTWEISINNNKHKKLLKAYLVDPENNIKHRSTQNHIYTKKEEEKQTKSLHKQPASPW